MKKFVFGLLFICLLIGVPLIIMSALSDKSGKYYVQSGEFTIPVGYKKIEIDLSKNDRNSEPVETISMKNPGLIDFFIQTDSNEYKLLQFTGNKKLIGTAGNTYPLLDGNGKLINGCNTTLSFVVDHGKYNIVVSHKKTPGKIFVYYKIKNLSRTDLDRLTKIDNGELDNPPKGYQKVFSTALENKNSQDEAIYKFTLDKPQTVGISAYANIKKGTICLRVNKDSYFIISDSYYIREMFDIPFNKGNYEIDLTSEDADGELYVFAKK